MRINAFDLKGYICINIINNFYLICEADGIEDLRPKRLGDLYILLEFENGKDAEELLQNGIWDKLFLCLSQWSQN